VEITGRKGSSKLREQNNSKFLQSLDYAATVGNGSFELNRFRAKPLNFSNRNGEDRHGCGGCCQGETPRPPSQSKPMPSNLPAPASEDSLARQTARRLVVAYVFSPIDLIPDFFRFSAIGRTSTMVPVACCSHPMDPPLNSRVPGASAQTRR
jgi:hypothetical protein